MESKHHTISNINVVIAYVSMLRLGIVGYFDGLEAYGPFHPELPRVWGAGMAEGLLLFTLYDLRLSCGTPLHVDVAIALVVSCGNLQVEDVVEVGIQTTQAHQQ